MSEIFNFLQILECTVIHHNFKFLQLLSEVTAAIIFRNEVLIELMRTLKTEYSNG